MFTGDVVFTATTWSKFKHLLLWDLKEDIDGIEDITKVLLSHDKANLFSTALAKGWQPPTIKEAWIAVGCNVDMTYLNKIYITNRDKLFYCVMKDSPYYSEYACSADIYLVDLEEEI